MLGGQLLCSHIVMLLRTDLCVDDLHPVGDLSDGYDMDGYTKNVNPHVMFMGNVLGENTFMHAAQVRIQLKELSEFPCSRGFPFFCDPSPPYF